ncbi:MAG: aminoacetone oxidase family FAD-binding enzyme [Chitinivibrionales bacterium]|nr:aminoacetone oxidase family FAD-binding enzyme [Chitinivibrionales bacterium]
MTKKKVIVVGGGPAGLMAAGQAAAAGASVVLLEKMERVGKKLSLTGNGRGNIANAAPFNRFLTHFGTPKNFLKSVFKQYFTEQLQFFFSQTLGMETVVEEDGRIFPSTVDASQIVHCLLAWIKKQGVDCRNNSTVSRLIVEHSSVIGVSAVFTQGDKKASSPNAVQSLQEREELLYGDAVIMATGGASYPQTGSSGQGYALCSSVGHHVATPQPGLVPLTTDPASARRLQAISLKNVGVTMRIEGEAPLRRTADLLFTHFGLSGPAILSLSSAVVDALTKKKKVICCLDLFPELGRDDLDSLILSLLDSHGGALVRTVLGGICPKKIVLFCLESCRVPQELLAGQLQRSSRCRIVEWLKNIEITITGHRGWRDAFITQGGVALPEIDPNTMASRLLKGLFFAGEIMDVAADTGGFNMQFAFSSGWIAGTSAAAVERGTVS